MKDILLMGCIVFMSLSAPIHLAVPNASVMQSASKQSHAAVFTEPAVNKKENKRKRNDDNSGTPLSAMSGYLNFSAVGV